MRIALTLALLLVLVSACSPDVQEPKTDIEEPGEDTETAPVPAGNQEVPDSGAQETAEEIGSEIEDLGQLEDELNLEELDSLEQDLEDFDW